MKTTKFFIVQREPFIMLLAQNKNCTQIFDITHE